jgi:hypothetical protein
MDAEQQKGSVTTENMNDYHLSLRICMISYLNFVQIFSYSLGGYAEVMTVASIASAEPYLQTMRT